MNTNALYYGFHALSFAAVLLYALAVCGHYSFPKWKAIVLCTSSFVSVYALMLILKVLITGSGGQNAIRSYIFLPLFIELYANALDMDIGKSIDFLAAAPCIVQGIGHIGCIFPGCCYSWLRVSWGIYNPVVHDFLFPVQLCESFCSLLVGLWILNENRRKNYLGDGRSMPEMMIAFGLVRFGWEFLRDNDKLFWGISELALWALGMALTGTIWLAISSIRRKKRQH